MTCPNCGHDGFSHQCQHCGWHEGDGNVPYSIVPACPDCGATWNNESEVCYACGNPPKVKTVPEFLDPDSGCWSHYPTSDACIHVPASVLVSRIDVPPSAWKQAERLVVDYLEQTGQAPLCHGCWKHVFHGSYGCPEVCCQNCGEEFYGCQCG